MEIWTKTLDLMGWPREEKSGSNITTHNVPQRSAPEIRASIESEMVGTSHLVSAAHACARVIAEGLALPPCYVHEVGAKGKALALSHPLYPLLNASPNDRQTSYEFREMLGWNLALHGNAYVFINRSARGDVLELLPCENGSVTVNVDNSRLFQPVQYFLYGIAIPAANMWHLKGPTASSYAGQSLTMAARKAIMLAAQTELFGSNMFINGAKPGGLIAPAPGTTLTAEQKSEIKAQWAEQAQGVANAHRTMMLNHGLSYTPMGSTANDAQWIESRRFQIEEICRYFRVSPTKVFSNDGSQSYASVEQAHIAHDQDTDAHWQERFVQSANKALLTVKDRRAGIEITLDNRDALRGTAVERMNYYQQGVAAGIFSRNEVREMEGFDRSDDPEADKLTPAANLFGPKGTPPTDPAPVAK